MTTYEKEFIDSAGEIYGESFRLSKTTHQSYSQLTQVHIYKLTATGSMVRYISFTYGSHPYCCGFGTMADMKYKSLEPKEARKLAKAFNKYLINFMGAHSGWSSMFHAVSEQEKGYQLPFLKAAGFKRRFTTISKGTSHKLFMMEVDVRPEDQKERAIDNYEVRYGDMSPYKIGNTTQ